MRDRTEGRQTAALAPDRKREVALPLSGRDRAVEAERIARRLSRCHPDPVARRVYWWIADRADWRSRQVVPNT